MEPLSESFSFHKVFGKIRHFLQPWCLPSWPHSSTDDQYGERLTENYCQVFSQKNIEPKTAQLEREVAPHLPQELVGALKFQQENMAAAVSDFLYL